MLEASRLNSKQFCLIEKEILRIVSTYIFYRGSFFFTIFSWTIYEYIIDSSSSNMFVKIKLSIVISMMYLQARGGLVADTAATAKIASTADLCNISIIIALRGSQYRAIFFRKNRATSTIRRAQRSQMKIQTNSRRRLVKTVRSGKQRSPLYRCVFFFLGFQPGEREVYALYAAPSPFFSHSTIPDVALSPFALRNDSIGIIIYSISRLFCCDGILHFRRVSFLWEKTCFLFCVCVCV